MILTFRSALSLTLTAETSDLRSAYIRDDLVDLVDLVDLAGRAYVPTCAAVANPRALLIARA